MDVDTIITKITEAIDETSALAVLDGIPRVTLDAVADQLYIDSYGRSSAVVRRAIVREGRS
jgi:hypothetical protein